MNALGLSSFSLKALKKKRQQKREGAVVVSQMKSELLLFVNTAVTHQILLRSWLTCYRK